MISFIMQMSLYLVTELSCRANGYEGCCSSGDCCIPHTQYPDRTCCCDVACYFHDDCCNDMEEVGCYDPRGKLWN